MMIIVEVLFEGTVAERNLDCDVFFDCWQNDPNLSADVVDAIERVLHESGHKTTKVVTLGRDET